ncbi:MAG: hydrogenase maturation peptidase HycI [Methanobacteriota archaeon]
MSLLILCIGNRDGGDDAVGPYIYDTLHKKHSTISAIDCGTTPENYTSVVKQQKPTTLLLIDAAEMQLPPGKIRIIPKEKIGTMHISTHGIPLSILISYLEQYVKKIFFIGIQSKTMHGPLTSPVKNSGDNLIQIIKSKNFKRIKIL